MFMWPLRGRMAVIMINTKTPLSGTFLQPGAFGNYDDAMWETHMKYLLEAGIDTVIIQWTANTPNLEITYTAYPSALVAKYPSKEYKSGGDYVVEGCLKAAQKNGMKVFLGLNESGEWWSQFVYNEQWNISQANLGNEIADELYKLYKSKYPDSFYGWYYVWEMFNGMQGYEKACSDMMNINLHHLTDLDPSMPLMLSPFVRTAGGTAKEAGEEWARFFATTDFRPGDIYCSQDAVGAGWMEIELVEEYFSEIKKAIDQKPGLLFWANNENFTDTAVVKNAPKDGPRFLSAPVDRFIKQMELTDPYVSGHVTFAYSHYYSPDRNPPEFHNEFISHLR